MIPKAEEKNEAISLNKSFKMKFRNKVKSK